MLAGACEEVAFDLRLGGVFLLVRFPLPLRTV